MTLPRLRFRVWTDLLCPWCYNVTVCLHRVREEVADIADLELEWKSYLLRPEVEPKTLDRFRRYTESWLRPAAQPDAGQFRVWATDENPPSHSVPPAVAARAAARQGAFDRFHEPLMQAYFSRNLDITARPNILAVARECGLELDRFERDLDDAEIVRAVVDDHNEAVELGISGVPCVVLDSDFQLPGSQDRAVYVRVVHRLLAMQGAA